MCTRVRETGFFSSHTLVQIHITHTHTRQRAHKHIILLYIYLYARIIIVVVVVHWVGRREHAYNDSSRDAMCKLMIKKKSIK